MLVTGALGCQLRRLVTRERAAVGAGVCDAASALLYGGVDLGLFRWFFRYFVPFFFLVSLPASMLCCTRSSSPLTR
ncbi:hypothetical protein AQJ64_42640 [Streptomyces griseoruber]|uniref:Uncharacterized protein n=1 Tax=Streptomyces griseoruber TaxID=1943 RepID=A0A101SKC0_9ACTN|nr:hypothetical protein AQJ64_42640 [Streptomyces griseoruber]